MFDYYCPSESHYLMVFAVSINSLRDFRVVLLHAKTTCSRPRYTVPHNVGIPAHLLN